MGLDEDNSTTCPRCGAKVPSGNAYCGSCGATVPRVSFLGERDAELGRVTRQPKPQLPKYERKYSIFERIAKVLFSPGEAMDDIGKAPDYEGVIVVFVLWTIITAFAIMLALPKIQFTGPLGDQANSMLAATMWGSVFLVPVGLIIRWLVKSYLIQHGCDSKAWDFGTAASVTGYAYLPNVIFSFVGAILSWILLPSIVINTTDLEQALAQIQQFSAETIWISVSLTMMLSVIAWVWKSKIGSYGAYVGTYGNCSEGSAFGVYMMVGGLGLLIDFVSNFL